jgi:23S rRNA (adenine2503-C2)-methyltransferase
VSEPPPREHLRSHTPESLASLWPDLSLEPAVARQIVKRLVREDRDDLERVPGLRPPALAELRARARWERLEVADRRRSRDDPFVKYLFRSGDGAAFEAVRIPLDRPRWSVCVSSQVGCGLGCAFCKTGGLGLTRNLEPWEMVEQVLTIAREAPERPVNSVVFQGQGEPLLNYDGVIRAAEILRDPCGRQIGKDRITISTAGVLPAIERFTEEGHPYRLVLSLVSAFGEKRAELMPAARGTAVADLMAAMRRLARARRKRVNLAWVLISGVNTGPEEAAELARLLEGMRARLSLIDVNDPDGRFRRPDDAERGRFLNALDEHGIAFVRRYSGGESIHAACGLLASETRGGEELAAPPESGEIGS